MADVKRDGIVEVTGVPGAVSACDAICVLAGNLHGLSPENKVAVEQIVGLAQGLRGALTNADPAAEYPYPYKVDQGRRLAPQPPSGETAQVDAHGVPVVPGADFSQRPNEWGGARGASPVKPSTVESTAAEREARDEEARRAAKVKK